MAEIKLNWDMDPEKRLEEEIKASKSSGAEEVGNHLLKCFKTNEQLKKDYKERKITLEKTWNHIVERAKKELNGKSGYVNPETVYGWAKDYIQDVKIEEKPKEDLVLDIKTKEEIKEEARKKYFEAEMKKLKEKQRRKKEKEAEKLKAEQQISLF